MEAIKNGFAKVVGFVQWTWKAVGAGVMAGGAFLYAQGIVDTSLNPIGAITDAISKVGAWTLGEWIAFGSVIAAAYGVTFFVRNKNSAAVPAPQ